MASPRYTGPLALHGNATIAAKAFVEVGSQGNDPTPTPLSVFKYFAEG